MAVETCTWRVRIGLFNGSGPKIPAKLYHVGSLFAAFTLICTLTLAIFLSLLCVLDGDVELNPGPPKRQDRPVQGIDKPEHFLDSSMPAPPRPARGDTWNKLPWSSRTSLPAPGTPLLHQKVELSQTRFDERERRYVPDPTVSPRKRAGRDVSLPGARTKSPGVLLQNVSTRLDQLNKFVVAIEKLERLKLAEYCFELQFDFSLKKGDQEYDKQMTYVDCIICGLLNGGGGYLFVDGQNCPGNSRRKHVDEWQDKVKHHLDLFVSKKLFVQQHIVFKKFHHGYDIAVHVKLSSHLITYRSNLHWRNGTSSIDLRDHSEIVEVINAKSLTKHRPKSDSRTESKYDYSYGEYFNEETNEREFKFYDTDKCEVIWNKIVHDKVKNGQISTFQRSVFAFANTNTGGEIILGVRDDTVVVGQKMSSADRKHLKSNIGELMARNIDGTRRIWGRPEYNPEEHNDWSVRFHFVKRCPGGEERFLVQIIIPSFNGCVFSAEPECYSLDYNGTLVTVPFGQWMNQLSSPQKRDTKDVEPNANDRSFAIDKLESDNNFKLIDETTIKALAKELHDFSKLDYTGNESRVLSWTKDSDFWKVDRHRIPPSIEMNWDQGSPVSSELLTPKYPPNVLPDKVILNDFLVRGNQSLSKLWSHMENQYPCKLTVLGCVNLSSVFPDLWKLKAPHGHVADMFILTEFGKMVIVSICTNLENYRQVPYILSAMRMLKKCLCGLLSKHQLERTPSFDICGYSWDFESEYLLKHFESAAKDVYPIQTVQPLISEMLFKGRFYLKNRLDEEVAINLTRQQMEKLLPSDIVKVMVLQGPPGSGKTIMALHICDRNLRMGKLTKEQMLYICPTKPLECFVSHQQKYRAQTAKTGGDLIRAVEAALREKVQCILIDDVQYMKVKKNDWLDVFDMINSQRIKTQLFIFMDSTYQTFLPYETTVFAAAEEYRKHHRFFPIAIESPLHEILRNSQVVASFFMANVQDVEGKDHLSCNHGLTGDEVTVQVCHDLLATKENPVVSLVEDIVNSRSWNYKHMYTHKAVVVLVDSDGQGNAKKLVKDLRKLFKKIYPQSKPQSAEAYPVEGVVIEELNNFIGLEADAAIVVLADQFDRIQHLKRDTYLPFLSSRGIMRVAFLLQKIGLPEVIKLMNFSEDDVWIKRSHDLLRTMKQLTSHPDKLEVKRRLDREVPKTPYWTLQVEQLEVSRKLRSTFHEGSWQEVEAYISREIPPGQHGHCQNLWLEDLKLQLRNNVESAKSDIEAWCHQRVPAKFEEEIIACYWASVRPLIVSFVNQKQPKELSRWVASHVPKAWLSGENVLQVFSALLFDNILKSEPTKNMVMIAEVIQEQSAQTSTVDVQVALLDKLYAKLQPQTLSTVLLHDLVKMLIETELVGVIAFNAWFYKLADGHTARIATESILHGVCSMDSIIARCQKKIASTYHAGRLTRWFEQNVPDEVYRDPKYVSALTRTIVQCFLRDPRRDTGIIQLYFSFVAEYLRTLNSLQSVIMDTVYATTAEINRDGDFLVIVNTLCRYNFVSVQAFADWTANLNRSDLAAEIRTLCQDYMCSKALTTSEEILRSYSSRSELANEEWRQTDHAWYWHDVPHYQCLVLATLCEAAVAQLDRHRVLSQYSNLYLPVITNKLNLLYSIQCIVHFKRYPPVLLCELWTMLLRAGVTAGKRLFSKDVFKEWYTSKYPLRREGRQQAVDAFRDFQQTQNWLNSS